VAIETPPEPLPQEPHQDYKEAKANAKAAKAYAKAQRPWYRKKRFIALMAIGGIFLIAIISAGCGGTNSVTTPTPAPTSAAPTTSTPEPTPDPEVSVNYTGPFSVHSDNVVLKGTVDPANAHVRVKGQSVEVRHGHWKLPVTLTKHGDNTFRVVATRKGYVKSSTTATIMRELSAAERAVIRQERAAARAGRRALASAESYLEYSGFSKQGPL
jgi:glucodextranase-like protein